MPNVAVDPIERAERAIIANLWQLYVHDFTELWAGEARGELNPDGKWGLAPLEAYWGDPACVAHLIRVDGHLAGFALLDRHGHSDREIAWNMGEFFIVRKHRRDGVGRRAAHILFSRHPGRWEVAVTRKNRNAYRFWASTIADHPMVGDVEERDQADERWNGAVFNFAVTSRS